MAVSEAARAEAEAPLSRSGHLVVEWKGSWRPGLAALLGGAVGFPLYTALASLFVVPL